MKKHDILDSFITETVASMMKPEDITWDLKKLPDEGSYDQLRYSKSKVVNAARRGQKALWNKYASHGEWNDPQKVKIIHSLGYYSGHRHLYDYFGLKSEILDYGVNVLKKKKASLLYSVDAMYEVIAKMPDEFFKGRTFAGIQIPSKDELSCFGFPADVPINNQGLRPYFSFKKYYVTFASAYDSNTERLSKATAKEISIHAQSGLPKRPMVAKKPLYNEYMTSPDEIKRLSYNKNAGEVVIDNWLIDGVHGIPKEEERLANMIGLKFVKI